MPAKVFAALPAAERTAYWQRGWAASRFPTPTSVSSFKTLKPFIDAKYRTDPRREATFIMGSSMGGLISLYAIGEYPQVFGGAGCLSSHWPLPLLGADGMTPVLPREPVVAAWTTWLDAASARARHGAAVVRSWRPTPRRLLRPLSRHRIDAQMVARGPQAPGATFISRAFPGASHNETAWAARIDQPLAYLLAPR